MLLFPDCGMTLLLVGRHWLLFASLSMRCNHLKIHDEAQIVVAASSGQTSMDLAVLGYTCMNRLIAHRMEVDLCPEVETSPSRDHSSCIHVDVLHACSIHGPT